MNSDEDKLKAKEYELKNKLGSGAFGTVYSSVHIKTKEKCAIKKVLQDQKYKNRELDIIKTLNHPNLVKLIDHYKTLHEEANSQNFYLNIVMELMPETLSNIIKKNHKSKKVMNIFDVKLYSYQMLRAISYCNAIGICHRDIKTQNILVDNDKKILKLIDFGSAKRLINGDANIAYICSRYYRAPELCFNATHYTTSIDTWSVGCVIAELVLGQAIFQGESNVDQVVEIIKVLGTPSKQQIKLMNPDYTCYKFPFIKSFPMSVIFKKFADIPDDYFDLLRKILIYEPEKRLKPLKALSHPFFEELKDESVIKKLPPGFDLKLIFEFSEEETKLNEALVSDLIPSWYSNS